jgi:hypothetical protein
LSEQNEHSKTQDSAKTQEPKHSKSSEADNPGANAGSESYTDHVQKALLSPDTYFETGHRSDRSHAMLDVAIYAGVVFLAALFARITGYSSWDFEFGYLLDAAKGVLTMGIALAAAVAGLGAYGSRAGASHSTGFYLEKLGAGLLLPAILLLAAIGLDILDARIHTWFRGLSVAFVYVLVFGLAYRYAAPGRLKVAAGFLASFYILYRLLALLF